MNVCTQWVDPSNSCMSYISWRPIVSGVTRQLTARPYQKHLGTKLRHHVDALLWCFHFEDILSYSGECLIIIVDRSMLINYSGVLSRAWLAHRYMAMYFNNYICGLARICAICLVKTLRKKSLMLIIPYSQGQDTSFWSIILPFPVVKQLGFTHL